MSQAPRLVFGDEAEDPLTFQRDQWEVERAAFAEPWALADLAQTHPRISASLYLSQDCVAYVYGQWLGDEAEIWRVATLPPHRGRGLARRLLEGVHQRLREKECTVVFLEVSSLNHAALALYRGLGYIEIGRRKHYYGPGDDALNLKLELAGHSPKVNPG